MTTGRSSVLLAAMLAGLVAGLLTGWLAGPSAVAVMPLGTFFLDALKMLVVPVVVTSMITGVASLGDVRRIGRTGVVTLAYFATTTAFAVALGLLLVNLVRPGEGADLAAAEIPERLAGRDTGAWQVLLSFVHPSLVGAMAEMKVLPLLVFSLLFGGALTTLGEEGAFVLRGVRACNEAVLKVVMLVIWIAPLGIFALVAGQVGRHGGLEGFLPALRALGAYAATVVGGLALHGAIVLPLILLLLGRRRPLPFLRGVTPALTTAFSTASSSATLPVTVECMAEANAVDRRACGFVLPLGATINMDGTALYEAVAALFIAQAYGIHLGPWEQLVVFVMATLAAVGAAGIPEAGLVTMVMVLTAVGLPVEGIGLILAIDWVLDRFRTTVNVWGDMVGAAVVERHGLPRIVVEGAGT